jgi:transcriptional regulator with XRE-family HTH domain
MKISISDNIRLIREAKGYSQDYIAKKMKVSQQAYSSMEKQPDNMSLKRLKDLCLVLDVNLVTLLGEDNIYVQQNYNQQGGQASTKMTVNNSSELEKELYERIITQLKEEVSYLKSITKNKQVS